MKRVPDDIPGLGKTSERWRQNQQFDVTSFEFDRDSYFLWTRFDGHTSTRDVILMVGLPIATAVNILQTLRTAGALLRPGETPKSIERLREQAQRTHESITKERAATEQAERAQAERAQAERAQAERAQAERAQAERAQAERAQAERAQAERAQVPSTGQATLADLNPLNPQEQAALDTDVELSDQLKLRIIHMRRVVESANHFELFGLTAEADKRTIKRAYFELSKEFHPDRYYSKNTGPFAPWLADIFDAISSAFKVLGNKRERERYEASLTGQSQSADRQSPEEYAAQLFERACNAEAHGLGDEAMKLFAAVIRMDPQVRYLARAARCATAAGILDVAQEYAREAHRRQPQDPSIARVLADVHRRAGDLRGAEQLLMHALGIKNENDRLVVELQRDLQEVQAALGES